MEQNSISGFNSDQESFQNSGEGTIVKPCNNEILFQNFDGASKNGQKGKKIKTYSKSLHFQGPFFRNKNRFWITTDHNYSLNKYLNFEMTNLSPRVIFNFEQIFNRTVNRTEFNRFSPAFNQMKYPSKDQTHRKYRFLYDSVI